MTPVEWLHEVWRGFKIVDGLEEAFSVFQSQDEFVPEQIQSILGCSEDDAKFFSMMWQGYLQDKREEFSAFNNRKLRKW